MPSAEDDDLSFSLIGSKSRGENVDTSALRMGANASNAATKTSAPLWFGTLGSISGSKSKCKRTD